MKIYALLILSIFISLFSSAQKTFVEDEKEQFKEIKMQKFPYKGFPKKTPPIASIQFMQVVPDSSRLGYLQRGLLNEKVTAVTNKPLTEFFQSFINKKYDDDYKKVGDHLLWVLKNIRINERTFFSKENSYLHFDIDGYKLSTDNKYVKLTSLDTLFVNGGMVDATSLHSDNIELMLKIFLQQNFDSLKANPRTNQPVLTIEEIKKIELERFNKPILSATTYSEGIFLEFPDFVANKTIKVDYSIVTVNKKAIAIVSNQNDTLKPWGLCKNGELYKYHENTLVPIEKQVNNFLISDYVAKINRRNENIVFAGIMGGLLGGAIANSTSNKVFTVNTIPHIVKKPPEASSINMKTGDLFF